ncbi:hypothetical protein J2Y69_003053 [Microbacterium resistens]|uniref:Uncharacterized protein n=1 Tax=Microbacterium resistens TaxID=156977 RepID=A0ABU1SFP5_9MICO|nr:hypothetical protein [Microbacterium resistens]MDR6868437.1 hypothetical protein [Microbacterium resistens]
MTYDPETYSVPEIARLLKDLRAEMGGLREQVQALAGTFVTRGEFEAWRTAYDREVRDLKADLTETRTATAPVRVSGWTIAAFGLSAVVGLGSLLGLAITLINIIP